jgi:hypothetical protein
MTIENVGYEGKGYGLTNEQVEKCAQLIAHGSKLTGIKPSRATVLGHRDYNSIDRMYCPTRYNLDYLLGRIINRANQLLAPAPAPAPAPTKGVPNVLLRRVRQEWITRNGGVFWTNGPGMGQRKNFSNGSRLVSHFESAIKTSTGGLITGPWRVISYNGEGLWMHRDYLSPVSGTRNPTTGFGEPR